MKFTSLVKAQLFPIFQEYGFNIIRESENTIQFKSLILKINVVFNKYDKSHLIEIGKEGALYPLNNNVVKELFDSNLSIEEVTSETFVQNLSVLFKTRKGAEMLNGNVEFLKKNIIQQSEDYTSELMQKQELEAAWEAWEVGDYEVFINKIDRIGVNKVPQSYQLKYKIAKHKL
ncbi:MULTISPECIES: hypothetical protein [unclassified Dysgonomonas]|uniref:hypothetical protein n=1 Tax=unclassified Dysgonomonas TaxID=2630389 RepID=UPI002476EF17|nr:MULTISPECIES: hypothetical protein [unclassified Dysgonomonas]